MKKNNNKRVAFSYIRMSTKSQRHGDSKRRQLARTKEFAKKKGFIFKDTIEDIGISAFRGKNIKDGELGKFREALNLGLIDSVNTVLLVESLDRLSRDNAIDALTELNDFIKTGISIITVADGQEYNQESLRGDNSTGLLFTAIGVMIRANEESKTKSQRLAKKWEYKRSNISEKPLTSICPAWLTLNKKTSTYEKIPTSAKTVEKIFELTIDEDMGVISIVRYLNNNISNYPLISKPKKGKKPTGWYESYIKKILGNPAVFGQYQPHKMMDGKRTPVGEPVNDYFPSIMSEKKFNLAQACIQKRKKSGSGRKGNTFTNLFSRLITCSSCGGNVNIMNKGPSRKGGIYLLCNNSKHKIKCECPAWNYQHFEDSFLYFLKDINLQNIFLDGDEEMIEKDSRNELTALNSSITKCKKEVNSFAERIGLVTEKAFDAVNNQLTLKQEELDNLKEKRRKLKLKLARLEDKNTKLSHNKLLQQLDEFNENLPPDELKHHRRKISATIKDYVDVIIIHNPIKEVSSNTDLNDIPLRLLEELFNRSKNPYNTTEKLKSVFDTDYGKRLYNETQRNFTVVFKSGKSRTVWPYEKFSIKGDHELTKTNSQKFLDDAEVNYEEGSTALDCYYKSELSRKVTKNDYDETINEYDAIIKDAMDDLKRNS